MNNVTYLTDFELDELVQQLDLNSDGFISYQDIESQLDKAYYEIQPVAKAHNLHHTSRKDNARHEFLRYVLGTDKNEIAATDFKEIVRSWNIPSVEQEKRKEQDEKNYLNHVATGRKLRALWEVEGPEYMFIAFVIASQITLGIWQCWKYTGAQYQAAFGWGMAFAKFSAGALYPTLFFLLLSMSRWFQTWTRNFYYVSRFANFDKSQSFHIYLSVCVLIFATLHTVGHLSGTFVHGSRAEHQAAVAVFTKLGPQSYLDYIHSVAGWTGLTSLALIYIISALSAPYIRRKLHEVFQLGHLLMFPFLGLMAAHGSQGLLQFPVLGIILAVPTILILLERTIRFLSAFHGIPATIELLDQETVTITFTIPKWRNFGKYEPGQYVFLCVPQLSLFQWHPFTISTCTDRKMQLHIQTSAGDWTSKLRTLELNRIAVDGPYGAPAQRFYEFDQTIIVGAGIGVTPFSGILNDLQTRGNRLWKTRQPSRLAEHANHKDEVNRGPSAASTGSQHQPPSTEKLMADTDTDQHLISQVAVSVDEKALNGPDGDKSVPPKGHDKDIPIHRRSDFHWIVRDKNHLLWFSSLLNEISSDQHCPELDIRIHPHLTKSLKNPSVSLHVYQCLLEMHRTELQPISPLTGLIATTTFGRPDFPKILNDHYRDMLTVHKSDKLQNRKRRVGVFFCGAPVIGAQLADLCHQMTLQGREDGTGIEYHFQMEVFG